MGMKSAGIEKVGFDNFVLRRNTDCHPSAATRRLKISPGPGSSNFDVSEQWDFWCLKNVHGGHCKIMLRQIKQA